MKKKLKKTIENTFACLGIASLMVFIPLIIFGILALIAWFAASMLMYYTVPVGFAIVLGIVGAVFASYTTLVASIALWIGSFFIELPQPDVQTKYVIEGKE